MEGKENQKNKNVRRIEKRRRQGKRGRLLDVYVTWMGRRKVRKEGGREKRKKEGTDRKKKEEIAV